jgi:hypothetical protein
LNFINISELVSKLNMYYQLEYYHFKYTSTRLNIFSENIIDSKLAFYINIDFQFEL